MKNLRILLMLIVAALISLPALASARDSRPGARRPPAKARTVPKVDHRAPKTGEKGHVDKRVPPSPNLKKDVERTKYKPKAKDRGTRKANGVDRKNLERQPPGVVVPPRPAEAKRKRAPRRAEPRKLKRR